MIAELAIATGLLAIFEEEGLDYDELLRRAILLGKKSILFDHLSKKEMRQVTASLFESYEAAPKDQKKVWMAAMRTFAPLWHWNSVQKGARLLRAVELAKKDYEEAREGRIGFVLTLHGYRTMPTRDGDDRVLMSEVELDVPLLVAITDTKQEDVVRISERGEVIDPYWNVGLLEPLPKETLVSGPTDGFGFFWIWGPSINIHRYEGGP